MAPIKNEAELRDKIAKTCSTSERLRITGDAINEDLIGIRTPPSQERKLLSGFFLSLNILKQSRPSLALIMSGVYQVSVIIILLYERNIGTAHLNYINLVLKPRTFW